MTVLLILVLNFVGKVALVAEPGLILKSGGLHKADFASRPLFRLPALITQFFHMGRYGMHSRDVRT